jgi:hypothetical protein
MTVTSVKNPSARCVLVRGRLSSEPSKRDGRRLPGAVPSRNRAGGVSRGFLHRTPGSSQSKESDERMEAKLDRLLEERGIDPDEVTPEGKRTALNYREYNNDTPTGAVRGFGRRDGVRRGVHPWEFMPPVRWVPQREHVTGLGSR